MKKHGFALVLNADPNEKQADKLYGTFNDGPISTIAGVPQIHFRHAAESLEEAVPSGIADVRAPGFDVQLVAMLPNAIPT